MDLLLLYYFAAFKKLADACGCVDLSLMGTDLMYLRVEWFDAAVICFELHRTDLVSPVRKSFRLDE